MQENTTPHILKNNQITLASDPDLINGTQPLPVVDNDCEINNETYSENVNYTALYFADCLISGKTSKRDPLLEISNETFVTE